MEFRANLRQPLKEKVEIKKRKNGADTSREWIGGKGGKAHSGREHQWQNSRTNLPKQRLPEKQRHSKPKPAEAAVPADNRLPENISGSLHGRRQAPYATGKRQKQICPARSLIRLADGAKALMQITITAIVAT